MPEFGNAFSGLAAERKLTHPELVRAIRMMIAAEYEAVQLYMQLAESIDNELAKTVLKDVADEEIVHAGEFLTLLKALEPSEAGFYAEGAEEVQEIMAGLAGDMLKDGSEPGGEPDLSETQPSKEMPTVGNLFGRN
jgi:rubrerythrin